MTVVGSISPAMFEFMLITSAPSIAAHAVASGVDLVFVDMEIKGKQARQAGRSTVISGHSLEDVAAVRAVVPRGALLVRINPWDHDSRAEVEAVLECGADRIMLPMFRGPGELEQLVRAVDGRARVVGLLETAESGAPFTVITTANTTNAFPAGSLRPNVLRNPALSERSISRWFDTGAFAAPAQFTFGNSPRSGLRGAALLTTDVTLEKSFQLREKVKFDLRSEFYNILNHANFNVPGATFGAADFGLVTSARNGRTVQLAGRLSF